MRNFFNYPFHLFYNSIESLGKFTMFIFSTFKSIDKWYENLSNILNQMIIIGIKSMPIVIFTSLFSGMVTAVQAAYQFNMDLGIATVPHQIVGGVIGGSILIELAPMITGLVMTGKIGATIAAEIGSMRVSEQIDALEALSFDPVAYLIMPRILTAFIMFPILIMVSDFFGIIGGMITSINTMPGDFTAAIFLRGFKETFRLWDVIFGLIKGTAFGFAITSIACYKGYYTNGGAQGVGKSTTETVVLSCIAIVILDYILAELLL